MRRFFVLLVAGLGAGFFMRICDALVSTNSTVRILSRTSLLGVALVILIKGIRGIRSIRQDLRGFARFERGECLRCGYDLRATESRCPECGMRYDV